MARSTGARELAENRKVAARLGAVYLQAFDLSARGKRQAEISKQLGLSASRISVLLSAVNCHLAFFNRTGRLPEKAEPHPGHLDAANTIIERYFPSWHGSRRSHAKRAIAIGLAGALPLHPHEINALAAAVKKVPLSFPAQLHFLSESRRGR